MKNNESQSSCLWASPGLCTSLDERIWEKACLLLAERQAAQTVITAVVDNCIKSAGQ